MKTSKSKKSGEKIPWLTAEVARRSQSQYYLVKNGRESIIFLIFLANTTFIALGMVYPSMYYLTQMVRQQFTDTIFESGSSRIKFDGIRSFADFWSFTENTFISALYWDYWYDEATAIKEGGPHDKGISYENKLVGLPRIRQIRVRNNSCIVHSHFRDSISECFAEFSTKAMDTEAFGEKNGTVWIYSKDTGCATHGGKMAIYGPDGYYALLSYRANSTAKILKRLKESMWLSRGTRMVSIDLTVYNANVNLFCIIKLMFEFPATGGVIPTAYIYTVKLIRYVTTLDHVILGCEVLYACFIIFYLIEEIREILYFKWEYFTLFWTYIDQLIIWVSVSYFGLLLYKSSQVRGMIRLVSQNRFRYFPFVKLALLQLTSRNLQGIVLLLIYLKIFKYINVNRTMSQLSSTLRKSAKDLSSFLVMFLLIFVAFAQSGYLLFGTQVTEFSKFGIAMFTLLRTVLGEFDYPKLEKAQKILAPIYFLLFIFLVFFVLLNMFLAIINDTYTAVKTGITDISEDVRFGKFLKTGYYNFMREFGCMQFMKRETVTIDEQDATSELIRKALKRCGFADMDIDMFFARYNIDPSAVVDEADVTKLIEDLQNPSKDTDPESEENYPLVSLEEFIAQQERLDNIEKVMANIAEKLETLVHRLNKMKGVKK